MPDPRIHPEEVDLIRYSDGELRSREAEHVTRHLEACWDCRTRLDELKQTIAEYVRYRRDVVEPALPEPPLPWKNLRVEFARLPAPRRFPRPTVWLIACAAAASTGVVLYRTNGPKPAPAPPAVVLPAPRHAVSAPPAMSAARPAPRKPIPGPEDELRVIAALDRIGAGLGDPIEVQRTRDHIVVTCMGLSPERMKQVRAAVATLPDVAVEESSRPPVSSAGSALDVVGARPPADDQQAADELLKHSEAMMARAHALRALAIRFPVSVEAGMKPDAKALLSAMRQRHESALASEVSAIAAGLGPLPQSSPGPAAENWQARTLRLFSEAEQVDRLLGAVYAGNRTDTSNRAALAAAAARLKADAQ